MLFFQMVGIILVYCFYLLTGWLRGGLLGFSLDLRFLKEFSI